MPKAWVTWTPRPVSSSKTRRGTRAAVSTQVPSRATASLECRVRQVFPGQSRRAHGPRGTVLGHQREHDVGCGSREEQRRAGAVRGVQTVGERCVVGEREPEGEHAVLGVAPPSGGQVGVAAVLGVQPGNDLRCSGGTTRELQHSRPADVERFGDLEQPGPFSVADLMVLQVLDPQAWRARCRTHGHKLPHRGQQAGHFLR